MQCVPSAAWHCISSRLYDPDTRQAPGNSDPVPHSVRGGGEEERVFVETPARRSHPHHTQRLGPGWVKLLGIGDARLVSMWILENHLSFQHPTLLDPYIMIYLEPYF